MPIRSACPAMASAAKPAADSVAKGTLTNLGTRLLGVAAVLAITTLDGQPVEVVNIANALWTQEMIDARLAKLAAEAEAKAKVEAEADAQKAVSIVAQMLAN